MSSFLENVSEREKWLLTIMVVLMVFVGGYLAVYRPLVAAEAASERSLLTAEHVYRTVEQAARLSEQAGENSSATAKRNDDRPIRVIAAVEARQAGVNISRIQPGEGGSVTIWIDAVAPQTFYNWAVSLQEKYGLSPQKVSLEKTNNNGAVRVQLQFANRAD